jgi:hypothetical protein
LKINIWLASIAAFIIFVIAFSYFQNRKKPSPLRELSDNQIYSFVEIDEIVNNSIQEKSQRKNSIGKFTKYVLPKLNYEDLVEALKDNNVCKIENSKINLSDIVRSMLEVKGFEKPEPEFDQLFIDVFKQTNEIKSPESEYVLKFFNALLFADLFYGQESPKVDYGKARYLLEDLKKSDPSNGIYAFINAYVLSKLGSTKFEIKDEFLIAMTAPKIDFFTNKLKTRLYEKSVTSSAHFLLHIILSSRLPDIYFTVPTFLLFSFIEEKDPVFNRNAILFAKKLIPSNVKVGEYPVLNRWEYSSYMSAEKILSRAWPAAFPGQPKPDYQKLKHSVVIDVTKIDQSSEAFEKLTKSSKNFFTCDREKFDVWFTEHKISLMNRQDEN